MNLVHMLSPEGVTREVEAPSEELIQLMVAGWVRAPQQVQDSEGETQ